MKALLGIDVGTSATRASLIGFDGMMLGTALRSHSVLEPMPDFAEHDAHTNWWSETVEVLHELATHFPLETQSVQGIGISTIGSSIVPVDTRGNPVRPAILYGIDRRALKQGKAIETLFGRELIRARTGRDVSAQSIGPKVRWIAENEPSVAAMTSRFLPPSAFLTQHLCGRAAIDYHQAISFHPLFRVDKMEWDVDFVPYFCRLSELPEVVPAGTPLGGLLPDVARATRLKPGIPVCCGTADVLAEGLGCGATEPSDTVIMYGSTLFVVHVREGFRAEPPFWSTVYPISNFGCVTAGTSTAGAAADWLLELFDVVDRNAAERLLKEASEVSAGKDGLVFLPYLRGERAPIFNPHARGVLFGLSSRHQRAHLYRAVIEGIAFSLRHVLETMNLESKRVFAAGGGSALEFPLQQAVNITGIPQYRARRGRTAAYGAAVLAGLGLGFLTPASLDDRFYGGFDILEPQQGESLNEAFGLYLRVLQQCSDLFTPQH